MGWRFCLHLVSHVGQQGNVPGALDGHGQLTLMSSTNAGHSAGEDLASLGDVLAKLCSILIIDACSLIYTELADLAATANFAMGTLGSLVSLFHDNFLSLDDLIKREINN